MGTNHVATIPSSHRRLSLIDGLTIESGGLEQLIQLLECGVAVLTGSLSGRLCGGQLRFGRLQRFIAGTLHISFICRKLQREVILRQSLKYRFPEKNYHKWHQSISHCLITPPPPPTNTLLNNARWVPS